MINISYLPNIFFDDFILTLKTFLKPWQWKEGSGEAELKQKIEEILGGKTYLFASGRGALWAILKALKVGNGDEVIIQAFTCVAVVDPILAVSAKPVYADIDESDNLQVEDVRRKITPQTKALIIQHTFGQPADIEKITKLAKQKNIFLIEDLAHSFGGDFKGKKLGTFGDLSFLSFGRTKVISSMFGGVAVINDKARKYKEINERMEELINKSDHPSSGWIFKQLFHQLIFYILKPIYSFLKIGKTILFLMSKAKILSREVEEREKNGEMVDELVKKMPNSLCILAVHQLNKLNSFLLTRKKISEFYQSNLDKKVYRFPDNKIPYLRFPVEVKNKNKLINLAKKRGIYLGDWYSQPIAPKGVDLNKARYKRGSCPKAEKANSQIVNLPTNPTLTINQVKKVVEVLNDFTI